MDCINQSEEQLKSNKQSINVFKEKQIAFRSLF
jgi:hypothetical protein